VKVFVDEPGRDEVIAALADATVSAISRIGFVECRAALARARRERRIRPRDEARAVRALDAAWDQLAVVGLDDALAREAARLAGVHPLRAADAIHLASAGVLASGDARAVRFACWDSRLSDAASELGFTVIPDEDPAS